MLLKKDDGLERHQAKKEFEADASKRIHLDEKLNQRVRATFRATRKVMGSQITQQVALQVIGNDTARAWRSQSHRLNEGGGSTDYRPRPGAASTAVTEDLAPLPPVAASTSPSLRSATDTAAALLMLCLRRSDEECRLSRLERVPLVPNIHSKPPRQLILRNSGASAET